MGMSYIGYFGGNANSSSTPPAIPTIPIIDIINKLQNLPDYQNIQTFTIPEWTVVRIEVTLVAKEGNNSNRATFKRVGLFYRENGAVKHQGTFWHTADTSKSHVNMNVDYVFSGSDVIIRTRNAGNIDTMWSGFAARITI
jgi:hypothetical protein